MLIRTASIDDLPTLLEIYNNEVENGFATFDCKAKTLEERKAWFYAHNINNHPLIVSTEGDAVTGYACLSAYRNLDAYKSTVELSIYVHREHRNKGIATALLDHILKIARTDAAIHNVISVITHGNDASVKLHNKFGFTFCGTIPSVGVKFDTFLSIDNYSLIV